MVERTVRGKDASVPINHLHVTDKSCFTHGRYLLAQQQTFPKTEFQVVSFNNEDAYLIKVTELSHNLLHSFVRLMTFLMPAISLLNREENTVIPAAPDVSVLLS